MGPSHGRADCLLDRRPFHAPPQFRKNFHSIGHDLQPRSPDGVFRKFVHLCSYHFVLDRRGIRRTCVAGLNLTVPPTVFDPKIFLTSKFFANFIQTLDLTDKQVADVGTGSGILALSAAKAGAAIVYALDINPAAAEAAALNAESNGFASRLVALHSDLFGAVPPKIRFDVIIASPPSFSGEPISISDRAWHAGPDYRDIAALFDQASERMNPGGVLYLLLSSDSDLPLFGGWIEQAGFIAEYVAEQSILVESFVIYKLRRPSCSADAS